ncbi:polysaccharide export protein [Sphingomonas sp. IC-56]|uniref:polysaccharide biosynthesis/export family protein n=1 Tax=Sphingomonas sp. IC-56 TaxID=2898529 RepID=UPI001E431587|nr:polysaccharide biosynthesis/export family protein [Sphingomonas sp. IC-56]MCD2323317.1 polysaccharide export protein [Sphingomonas sp. IC-56]
MSILKRSVVFRTASLVLCVALIGCASRPLGGSEAVKVVDSAALPEPGRADLVSGDRPYLIGPFDKLTIDVFGIPELSQREVQTDASGRLSFPLVGTLEVAGQTPSEVQEMIKERLRGSYVRDPQVTVNLKETVSQMVTVDGEVRDPGLFPVVGRMTLMRAIATAKGTAQFAKLDDVVVFRTVQGQRYAALYNLKAIRRGAYSDPEIFANDVIVVGDSPGRRLFSTFLQAAPILSGPLIVALQN